MSGWLKTWDNGASLRVWGGKENEPKAGLRLRDAAMDKKNLHWLPVEDGSIPSEAKEH